MRLLLADLSEYGTVNQSDAQRIRTPTPQTSSRQIGNTRTPRNLSLSTLNHLAPLFLDCRADVRLTPTLSPSLDTRTRLFQRLRQNAARTRSAGRPQLTTLPPLSSSFVSDGVVSLLVVSFHGAKQWRAHNGCQTHSVTPLRRGLKRLVLIDRSFSILPSS
ncbi:hypothetical protein BLNAU_13392 [Blattamonas nauphoetae]|uniref:Uncharacterized protein n=1 Tax=Blattamonas nauphoetae TaxID=2049346 RepID=A0ABQ9XGR7_9EUKA|nr:hypothetical protein BLNAU_13392 [Blattamonas nauphoetae]